MIHTGFSISSFRPLYFTTPVSLSSYRLSPVSRRTVEADRILNEEALVFHGSYKKTCFKVTAGHENTLVSIVTYQG
jgi:hypothetical protein